MAMAGYPEKAETQTEYDVQTCERIVEVPMVQIVEKIVYVQTADIEKYNEEHGSYEDQLEEAFANVERASFESPLAVGADPSADMYHPREAYLGEDKQKALEFFRDNGFLMIPDAVPLDVLDAARNVCIRDGVRDNGSPEVLNAVTQKIWDAVKMLVADPIRPKKCQVAKVARYAPEGEEAAKSVEATKKFYFPQDMHIDGLPNEATTDINNFSCLVGIPLDATTEPFMGNFGVSPGSHVRIQDAAKKDGFGSIRVKQWLEPLKQMSEVRDFPFLALRAVPGQAYIAHYQTVHFAMPNFHGADPRRVMYFRIWNDRGGDFMEKQQDHECILNVFKEFPNISGTPVPLKRLEKKTKKKVSQEPQPFQTHIKLNGFMPDGGDIFVAMMTVSDAKNACFRLPGCKGFTFNGPDDDGVYEMHFKNKCEVFKAPDGMVWTTFQYIEPWTKFNGFMPDGGDLLVAKCTIEQAKCKAMELAGCQGFTLQGVEGQKDVNGEEEEFTIHWKDKWEVHTAPPSMPWTSYKWEGPPIEGIPEDLSGGIDDGVRTVEKIVEVPMVQLVERIVEVDPSRFEEAQKEIDERNRLERERILNTLKERGHDPADLNSPLCIPADAANKLYHPIDAYLGEDKAKACRFFRDNGFLMLKDAVPMHLIEAARASVDKLKVRDIGSPEVLAALQSVWHAVKLLVDDPVFPAKCQVAVVPRNDSQDLAASLDVYFPNDMHIDGLPSGVTTDIMNFTCLVGIPLDPTEEYFAGNFGVLPGSHTTLEESFKSEGMDALRTKDWKVEDLKRLSGVGKAPFAPLRVVPGQAYIAHYQTVHFVMPNAKGANPRRVMYFRIWNRRFRPEDVDENKEGYYMFGDMSLMLDVFKEYPNVRNA